MAGRSDRYYGTFDMGRSSMIPAFFHRTHWHGTVYRQWLLFYSAMALEFVLLLSSLARKMCSSSGDCLPKLLQRTGGTA
jgi:hypothetical protein